MPKGDPFSNLKQARALLLERAREMVDFYIDNAKAASANGDFETASKAMQFLMERMRDEDGTTLVEQSVDKPKQAKQVSSGPSIQIGFKLGGVNDPKTLPEVTISKPEDPEEFWTDIGRPDDGK